MTDKTKVPKATIVKDVAKDAPPAKAENAQPTTKEAAPEKDVANEASSENAVTSQAAVTDKDDGKACAVMIGQRGYETLFQASVDLMIFKEGGDKLVRHPRDPGRLTKYGISSRAYPHLDVASLNREAATDIYRKDYFEAAGCDMLSPRLAIMVFGSAINQGVAAAVTMLQRSFNDCLADIRSDNGFAAFLWPDAREDALKALSTAEIAPLKIDGVNGEKTGKACGIMSDHLPELMAGTFCRLRAWRYANTVGDETFLSGWLDRLFDVAAAAETVEV